MEAETIQRFRDAKLVTEVRGDHNILLHARERIVTEYAVSWAIGVKKVRIIEGDDLQDTRHVPIGNYPLMEDLTQIEGIIQVTMAPYVISFIKANAFEWDDLSVGIVDAWQTYQLRKEFNT